MKEKRKDVIENNKQRTYYYDILRIIACLLVIVNHSEMKVFMNINISETWCISVFKFLLCKVAVPIFFMISGALLLKKDENYTKIIWRIVRMIVVIAGFSVVFSIIYSRHIPGIKEIMVSVLMLIKRPYFTAYWYLYALIGLYIMTPILRKLVKNMTDKDFKYYFIVWGLYTGLYPMLRNYINIEITGYFNLSIFNVYLGYYILGYYISNIKYEILEKIKTWNYMLLIFIPIVINFILTLIQSKINGQTSLFLDGYQFITVMISSASIFCFVKKKFENVNISNKLLAKSIGEIGKCTFGIYLIHIYLLDKTNNLVYYNISDLGVNYEIAVLVQQLVVAVVALIFIYIIRKIPIIKKII